VAAVHVVASAWTEALAGAGAERRVVSRRLDGGSNVAAVHEVPSAWTEAPAWPAPEQDGVS
jgi:hypothetical protein